MRTFSDPLRVGLVGCGDIAPAHAHALSETKRARLVACADVVEASARSLGEQFGVPFTADVAALVARDDVDLITIATPAFTHLEITQAAAKAGKAVLCEKPMAANLDDADDMISACEEAGVPLAVCFPARYLGAARWTRELLEAGALGRLLYVRMRSLSEKKDSYWTGGYSGRTTTDWRKSKTASGGGVFITNLSHHIDLARAITGQEAARAYAEVGTFATGVEVEDLGVATLRYENDAMAVIEGSSVFWGGNTEWDMVFLGTKGQVRLAFWGGKAETYLTEAGAGVPAREWAPRQFEGENYVAYYEDLAAELQAGREPPVTGEDGRAALEIVLGIYRAAGTGEPVLFPLEL